MSEESSEEKEAVLKDVETLLKEPPTRPAAQAKAKQKEPASGPKVDYRPGQYIYVLGGVGHKTKLSTILRFDVQANKWEDTRVPLHLNRGGAYFDRSKLSFMIFGGRKETQLISRVYLLDLISNDLQIDETSQVQLKRSGFGFFQAESRRRSADMLFVVGGNDGQEILKSVVCIKIDSREVAVLPDLNISRDELDVSMGMPRVTQTRRAGSTRSAGSGAT